MPAGFTKWSPDSGETIAERLGTIVAAAMGYEPEDLPWEVPLIELGLDSLMAVRIKNRVEYDFDLPPIQLQAVRDANLYNVEKLIEYALEHRDEVEQLHDYQKAQTARKSPPRRPSAAAQRHDVDGGRWPSRCGHPTCLRRPDPTAADGPVWPVGSRRQRRQSESCRRGRGAQPGGGRQGAQLRRAAARCC